MIAQKLALFYGELSALGLKVEIMGARRALGYPFYISWTSARDGPKNAAAPNR
jgi:hypothetical protein